MKNFLDADAPRKLRLRVKCEGRYTEEVRVVGGRELDNISRPEKQRTPSPNKRKAPNDTNPEDGHGDNPLKRSRLSSPKSTPPSDPRSTPSTNSQFSQSPKSSSVTSITFHPNDTSSAETRNPKKRKTPKEQRPKDLKLSCCDHDRVERNGEDNPGPRKERAMRESLPGVVPLVSTIVRTKRLEDFED